MPDDAQKAQAPAASMEAEKKEHNFWLPLIAIIMATFVSVLSSSLANVALPKLASIFGVPTTTIQWVSTGFMLASAVVIPMSGFLVGRFGSKRILLMSVIGFTVGSLLCGLSWNDSSLIAFRIFQGLAGGFIMPVGMAVMYSIVPRDQIGSAMGVWGVAAMVAPALGPTLGGYIVEYFSWRLLFFVNIPVGILAAVLCFTLLKESPTNKNLKFDIPGAILSILFFGSLLLALSKGQTEGWGSLYIVSLFYVAGVSLALLLWVELTVDVPLLKLKLFTNTRFSSSTLIAGLLMMAMMGGTYLMPIYLQNVLGMTALASGILLLPQSIAMAVMMPMSGKLTQKLGLIPLALIGLSILGVTTYELHRLTQDTSHLWINTVLTIRGMAIGACMMPITSSGLNSIPKKDINDASPLSNVFRQVMATMGIAILTAVMSGRQTFHYAGISESIPTTWEPATQLISTLVGALGQGGVDTATATSSAYSTLGGLMAKEALVRAIADTFFVSAIPAFICIPLMFLLLDRKKPEAQQPAGQGQQPSEAAKATAADTAQDSPAAAPGLKSPEPVKA